MKTGYKGLLLAVLFSLGSMSGCLGGPAATGEGGTELLPALGDPCLSPSEPLTQEDTTILVDGVERTFRLSVPSSVAGTELALIIAFHGGTDSQEDFAQQDQFDQLGEQEKFIMAYAIAEQDRTAAEGEWYLNTAATSRDDNNFSEQIASQLSQTYCVDQTRLYAIGYSLGAMFTYEIACQINHRFAAVASFAGTMPFSPETCNLDAGMGVMHIHGKLDYIIYYHSDWEWKEGEHEGVGTMSEVPALIDYWAEKSGCQTMSEDSGFFVEHIVHDECIDGVRIEHYGLELNDHNWPDEIEGIQTPELMWDFLSDFTKNQDTPLLLNV